MVLLFFSIKAQKSLENMFEKSAFSGKQKSYFILKKVSVFSSNIESIDYHSFIGACSCLVDKNIV